MTAKISQGRFPMFASRKTRLVLWFFLPLISLLAFVGVSLLKPSPLTHYLPLFAGAGVFLALRWKMLGFFAAAALLAVVGIVWLPSEMRLWQSGMLAGLALDFYIALVAFEEIEGIWIEMEESAGEHLQRCLELESVQRESEKNWNDARAELQKELERSKEEAEARRVEKSAMEKHLALVHSEIELLTSQKEEVLTQAFDTPQSDGQYRQLREQFQEKARILQETRRELFEAEGKLLTREREMREATLAPPSEEVDRLIGALATLSEENEILEETLHAMEDLALFTKS